MAKKEIVIFRKQIKLFLLLFLLHFSTISFSQNFWQQIPYPDSTWGLALNVERNDHIFFGNWEEPAGLYKSDPEIINWEYCNSTRVQPFDMAFNNDDLLFLACNGYIFKTSDMGNTFDTLHHSINNYVSVEIDDSNGIWIGCWGHILYSNDNGNNWDTLISTSPSEVFNDFAFGINGEVYAVSSHYTAPAGGFYRSMDNGLNWEVTGLNALNAQTVAVNAGGDIFVGCYFDGVFRSTDNGLNWTNVKNGIDATSIIIDDYNRVLSTHKGENWVLKKGVHISEDNGETWDTLPRTGLINKCVETIYLDVNNYLYALSDEYYGHQLFRTNNPIVGLKEINPAHDELHLFPNPNMGVLNIITYSPYHEDYQYKIFCITGILMQSGILAGNRQNTLNVSTLPAGVYMLQLSSNKDQYYTSAIFLKQ